MAYFTKLTALDKRQIDALRLVLRSAIRDGANGPMGNGEKIDDAKAYKALEQVAAMFGAL
jgi:hypothetical protein